MFERLRSWLWPTVPHLTTGLSVGQGDGLAVRAIDVHRATDYGRDILINEPDGWEHDQRGLWWVDGPGGDTGTGFGNPPPGADGYTGTAALPAVLRCTAIIADTIAGLPWRVYRGFDQQPTPRWMSDPQMLREDRRVFPVPIVSDPMSSVEFWTQWVVSALWFGDGFAYGMETDTATGQVKAPLMILDPQKISIRPAERFAVPGLPSTSYWFGNVELDPARVLRLRGEPPYRNGKLGTGVLARFASDLDLAKAMRNYASSIFQSGIPSGYLKVANPQVTEPQVETLQKRWMERHGGPRRKIAVLNASTEFVPITMSPLDSQLETAKVWSLRDIALAFGVPAYMLGAPGDSSTYANVESRMTELRTFTLLPWIRRIEACLDAQFPAGTEVKIITDGTLRADTSTRYAAYRQAIDGGWMTRDEVRAMEDRPPLPTEVTTDPEPGSTIQPGTATGPVDDQTAQRPAVELINAGDLQ